MKLKSLILFLFIACNCYSQNLIESNLDSKIEKVTVFLQGALISRTGKIEIKPGKSTLIVKSLSPHLDDKSIQVQATGNFTVLSVNHRFNYLNEMKRNKEVDSLLSIMETIEMELDENRARLEILQEKQDLLNKNKNLNGANSTTSLSQLKDAIEFYDTQLTLIKNEELKTRVSSKELHDRSDQIQNQITTLYDQGDLPSSEIIIRIESNSYGNGSFEISYLVSNAGWFPKYDIRALSIAQPLQLDYKAEVYQNTGVDWENVMLKFSNGNPNQSGVAPTLDTWYLYYARNTITNNSYYGIPNSSIRNVSGRVVDSDGNALPGVNVIVKGTTVGTVTNVDGRYSLTLPNNSSELVFSFIGFSTEELPITSENINVTLGEDVTQLSEVVVTGLRGKIAGVQVRGLENAAESIKTTTIENQTTVEFEVDSPYSIKSNGDKLSVELNKYEIDATYEYYAVPKLDKDAFLIARIIDWDDYNLLEGEANLFFEDAYVGRSILDAKTLNDTLDISLGRDKNIILGRTKINDFSKRRTVGSSKIDSRGFEIFIRNSKSQSITLTIFDQIPVSSQSDISVTPSELSGGILDIQTGQIAWKYEIPSQNENKFTFRYEVKYPKREKVILE